MCPCRSLSGPFPSWFSSQRDRYPPRFLLGRVGKAFFENKDEGGQKAKIRDRLLSARELTNRGISVAGNSIIATDPFRYIAGFVRRHIRQKAIDAWLDQSEAVSANISSARKLRAVGTKTPTESRIRSAPERIAGIVLCLET